MKTILKKDKNVKSGQKELELKAVKKPNDSKKVNVKSSKFWDTLYEDDPDMEDVYKIKK